MALRRIFCPTCGQETQIDDMKAFCFCLECGTKIPLQQKQQVMDTPLLSESSVVDVKSIIDEKLKEVDFYYKLSLDKQEAYNRDEEPVYYLKAQDMLIDLSQKYPTDYRIWWELCKPLDFSDVLLGGDIYNQYEINEEHFSKALDLAGLDVKKELIDKYDKYVAEKELLEEENEIKREEIEREKKKLQIEANIKKEQDDKNKRMKAEKEKQEKKQREEEELKLQMEEKQQEIMQNTILCKALFTGDYSTLDASYFQFKGEGNQIIIGIFRVVSNVLYLMSFRIDTSKKNVVYRDQTITIKFNISGIVTKFDNKPLRIKGALPPNDQIHIMYNGKSGYCANSMELVQDVNYINNLMQASKKSILSYSKTFI